MRTVARVAELARRTAYRLRRLVSGAGSTPTSWSISDRWLTATCEGAVLLSPGSGTAADVCINDHWLLAGRDARTSSNRIARDLFEVSYETTEGKLVDRFVRFAALGPNAWLRSLIYTNRSSGRQDLTTARMRLRPQRARGGAEWSTDHLWMAASGASRAVCLAYQATTDFYAYREHGGVVEAVVDAAWRLDPGGVAVIGSQAIWLGTAHDDALRVEAQRWFQACGLVVPGPLPEWTLDMILYEAGAHGHVESRFSDVGGFANLERQLDYLADLGVSALWINSVFRHKSAPDPLTGGWNHHDVLSYREVDPILGGLSGFQNLVRAAQARGIHPLGELVPWGGRSDEAAAFEEWFVRDRAGDLFMIWGDAAVDYGSAKWQQIMRNALAWLARESGVEGARIDVADGSIVNGVHWSSPRAGRHALCGFADARQLLAELRAGLTEAHPNPILIPETIADRPEYFALQGVIGYGYPFTRFLVSLGHRDLTDGAMLKRELCGFLERERGALPAGARVIRTLNNHDTVYEEGRVQQRFGAGLARALYGVCLVAPGVPMLYQEEEVGSAEALRRMNWARRRVPEMANGEPDYLSVDFAPAVLSVLRRTPDSSAVGLVNLSGRPVAGTVRLPRDLRFPTAARAYDAVSGRDAIIVSQQFSWELDAYETAILRLGSPPVGTLPARRFSQALASTAPEPPGELQVARQARGLTFRAGRLALHLSGGSGSFKLTPASGAVEVHLEPGGELNEPVQLSIENAAEWLVSGRSALLHDGVLRRHFSYPNSSGYHWNRQMVLGNATTWMLYDHTCPSGRLWQTVVEPLHPDQRTLAFGEATGAGLIVEVISSNAQNVVLTDRSDEPVVDPYGLFVRFYPNDPDLSPGVKLFGVGQAWVMDSYPAPASPTLQLSLRIRACRSADLEPSLAATRLALDSSRTVLDCSDQLEYFNHVLLVPRPATLTWRHLAPAPGIFRVGLELRHSERSATSLDLAPHYTVTVDGVRRELDWVQLSSRNFGDAWFGWAVTPPIELGGATHELRLTTRHPYCAVAPNPKLFPA